MIWNRFKRDQRPLVADTVPYNADDVFVRIRKEVKAPPLRLHFFVFLEFLQMPIDSTLNHLRRNIGEEYTRSGILLYRIICILCTYIAFPEILRRICGSELLHRLCRL